MNQTGSITRCGLSLLVMLAFAPVLSHADGMVAADKAQPAAAAGQAKMPPHVFMLVPTNTAPQMDIAKQGCWARIYSAANYGGDTLTLGGPLALADMSGPFGLNWDDRVESLQMGPRATMTVYDNEAFRDQVALFKPNQQVADISRPLGFFDEFASIRLTCTK